MSGLRLQDPAVLARLAKFLASASGRQVRLIECSPLMGGAIQENWLISAELDGERQEMVLRTDAPSKVAASHGRAAEFAILQAAYRAGVTVPAPLWLCDDHNVLGQDFYLMRAMPGIAAGHRLVRDKNLGGDRARLAERLGAELARIHAIKPGEPGLEFLERPRQGTGRDQIALLRADLDRRKEGHPVLEWGLRWLERRAAPVGEIVLLHHDFRTGNYLVDEQGLTAILDWEFAGWGEPMTDIGWFCAKCWRFGANDLEAGGIASRADFYRGYETASGRRIDPTTVHYWEVMAHLRWSVIALQQADRHLSGAQHSLELALTGRLLPELERNIVELVAPGAWPVPAPPPAAASAQPDGSVLLAEARRLMIEEFLPLLPEARHYEVRMAGNAMAIAGRELSAFRPQGPANKALALAIRAGRHDDDESLRDRLAADVLARLAISNPKALPRSGMIGAAAPLRLG